MPQLPLSALHKNSFVRLMKHNVLNFWRQIGEEREREDERESEKTSRTILCIDRWSTFIIIITLHTLNTAFFHRLCSHLQSDDLSIINAMRREILHRKAYREIHFLSLFLLRLFFIRERERLRDSLVRTLMQRAQRPHHDMERMGVRERERERKGALIT